jgi:hypothetical protein
MGIPPDDPSVDLSFLNDPTETEEQRRAFLASAIHYARRACALADELLEQREARRGPRARRGDGLPAGRGGRGQRLRRRGPDLGTASLPHEQRGTPRSVNVALQGGRSGRR